MTAVAGGSVGAKTKTTTTEAVVEATAITGKVDTLLDGGAVAATVWWRWQQFGNGGGSSTAASV